MYPIKNLLIALDCTEMDEVLVNYAHKIAGMLALQKIYFLHVTSGGQHSNDDGPAEGQKRQVIEEMVNATGSWQAKWQVEMETGKVAAVLLNACKTKDIDLLVMGNKAGLEGEGKVARKMDKSAPCHVALVPEVLPTVPESLLVPIDFSDNAQLALELAVTICAGNGAGNIIGLHEYGVPAGYHLSGKSEEEYAENFRTHADKAFDQFLEKTELHGVPFEKMLALDTKNNVAQAIYNAAVKRRVTGIVVGSRGRTKMAALLLGSVSEKLIKLNTHFPLIIAKEKNHNMSALEALIE
jgi:nucleotide-binding universal stress UspA family protein